MMVVSVLLAGLILRLSRRIDRLENLRESMGRAAA